MCIRDRPKTLYYEVPADATKYGDDAGKSVRLDFGGFGELWGIPGQVINVTTGEALGEFYSGDWNDNLRYVSRFMIEPHNGVDPVLTEKGSDTTYKVKALSGDQWLKLKASASTNLPSASVFNISIVLPLYDLTISPGL